MSKKVFISHAAADHCLVDLLINFLVDIGIPKDDIFCTSIYGSLESGQNFILQIKDNVQDSMAVLLLLSERFFLSYFCLAELGAAWALNQNIIPIIVPPISNLEYNNTPLLSIHYLNISHINFVEEFTKDLMRTGVISDSGVGFEKAPNFFDLVKNELGILRKDSKGFYVARLSNRQMKQEQYVETFQCLTIRNQCSLNRTKTIYRWKLNGMLEEKNTSNITEDWIDVGRVELSSTKIKFQVENDFKQNGKCRIFSLKDYCYELP